MFYSIECKLTHFRLFYNISINVFTTIVNMSKIFSLWLHKKQCKTMNFFIQKWQLNDIFLSSHQTAWLNIRLIDWMLYRQYFSIADNHHANDILHIQWRIQEFQNRGRGPGNLEFLGSGVCFDVSITHTLCFWRQ